MSKIQKIKCDVALLPVGGTYTMTAKVAANLANIIEPQIAIPTHYGTLVGTKEDAEKFKAEHAERASAVTEYSAVVAEEATAAAEESAPATQGSTTWFYALLIVLVAGLGYVLVRKDKKK